VDKLAELDLKHVWHPFTQMTDWLKREPIVIVRGRGTVLWDADGKEYLDANSSIWTNLHGHANRQINAAIKAQLKKIAHSSALGLANEPASVLAGRLVKEAGSDSAALSKVFYSDDGSTAMEVALKLSYEHWRRNGVAEPRFLGLEGSYHGDTIGAVSLGHIDRFHTAYKGLLFKSDSVMAPYCYRCPFNKAAPDRADARMYRKCNWECVGKVEEQFDKAKADGRRVTGFVVEPLIQGAAGMIPQPEGWFKRVAEITRLNGAHLIADEVLTGFGRATTPAKDRLNLFAISQEGVLPDFLALAKGLTGGYLPMAATLTTDAVFNAFLGEYEEFKTFFHGHSYTGNQLGSAAALASLEILQTAASIKNRVRLATWMGKELAALWGLPQIGDIRQVGLIAGIELVRDWKTREPFAPAERVGMRVCESMTKRGVLTRPIGNVVVIMPPYCTTRREVKKIFAAFAEAVQEVFGVRH
jgi:adenosylmethionine-8-amino-7-oxononanoate aminotransferase